MKAILAALILCAIAIPAQARSYHHHHRHHYARHHHHRHVHVGYPCNVAASLGGPCGCFASELIFGHSVRGLWRAWAWVERFPRTFPHPGAAAVHPHHVVIVERVNGDGTFTGHDSWGLTRRRIAGWAFVEPHGFAENHVIDRVARASRYGGRQRVACGGWLSGTDLTVAHRRLPCGTRVRFSYRGRTTMARVNDRGPFVSGREWDFGPAVARELRFSGVHPVSYQVVR